MLCHAKQQQACTPGFFLKPRPPHNSHGVSVLVKLTSPITSRVGPDFPTLTPLPQGRLSTVALCEASRDDVLSGIATFLAPRHHPKVTAGRPRSLGPRGD